MSEWITRFVGIGKLRQRPKVNGSPKFGRSLDCTGVKDATLLAVMFRRKRRLVSFGSRVGPHAGVVKRVAGVGGGERSPRTFFCICFSLMDRKEPSNTLDNTAKAFESQTNFS